MDRFMPNTLWDTLVAGTCRKPVRSVVTIACLMFCVAFGTLLSPEWFQSRAGLYFRLGRENSAIEATAAMGEGPVFAAPTSRDRELNSMLEIMRSRGLAEQVVETLGCEVILQDKDGTLTHDQAEGSAGLEARRSPREKAVLYLLKRMRIHTADDANIIWLEYDGRSPQSAQSVVQAYVDAYLAAHVRFNRTRGTFAFLEQQTREMLERVATLENDLLQLQTETQLVDPSEQRHSLIDRIGRIEVDLLQSRAQEQSLDSQIHSLQNQLVNVPNELVKERTSGVANNAADKMREQLFALQIKEQELLTRFTPAHPEIKAVHDQIEKVVGILENEKSQRVEETAGINQVQEAGQIKLLDLRPALVAATKRSEVLSSQLDAAKQELKTLSENQLKIARYEREIALAESKYQSFSKSLEQARLDDALEAERISNVTLIQPPTLEPKPILPQWPWNLALGFIAASIVVLAMNVWSEIRQTAQEERSTLAHATPMQPAALKLTH